jgi:DNA (cytosine-5)-methyltransferase 1
VPYHIYFQVLNAKHYGIPQNRERIFIIGIRDDSDNDFQFPKSFPLEKRLKDVLENEVDEKYFLGEKTLDYFKRHLEIHKEQGNGFGFKPQSEEDTHSNSLTTKYGTRQSDTYLKIQIADYRADEGLRIREDGNSPCITSSIRHTDEFKPKAGTRNPPLVNITNGAKIKSTKVSKEVRTEESKLIRKDTGTNSFRGKEIEFREQEFMNTITTSLTNDHFIISTNNSKGFDEAEEEEDSINFSNPNSETRRGRVGKKVSQTLDTQCNQGIATKQLSKQQLEKLQNLEVDENVAGCITEAIGRAGSSDEYISSVKRNAIITQRIRRLSPTECFRLMDFNQDMIERTISSKLISDSQLYKQAGNSICVGVLAAIINKLNINININN